jgi:hypothetical protein
MNKQYCCECHHPFIPLRNPHQRYCNQRSCQNARKRQWRKQKHAEDPDYRENQRRSQTKWLNKSPHYWRNYREIHPEYTQRNRQQTRERKRLAVCKHDASQFAKSDALTLENAIKPGTYSLVPMPHSKFAKSDALIVKISLITNNYPKTPLVCKETTL